MLPYGALFLVLAPGQPDDDGVEDGQRAQAQGAAEGNAVELVADEGGESCCVSAPTIRLIVAGDTASSAICPDEGAALGRRWLLRQRTSVRVPFSTEYTNPRTASR